MVIIGILMIYIVTFRNDFENDDFLKYLVVLAVMLGISMLLSI